MKMLVNRRPVAGPWGGGNNFTKALFDDTFQFAEDYSLWLRSMQWYRFANLEEVLIDYTAKHNENYNHAVPQFLCSIYRSLYGVR